MNKNVFAGFDGFVDEIIHVVDKRMGPEEYTRIERVGEYAARIAKAEGRNANFEYVTVRRKIGGNSTIFSWVLSELGNDIYYAGAIGEPPEPEYEPIIKKWRRAQPLCQCAHTDAVEFYDGKLIISKLACLSDITFDRLVERFGRRELIGVLKSSRVIGLMNWTMIPAMSDIWRRLQAEIVPETACGQYIYFDLSDPAKRRSEELARALELIRGFQGPYNAVLSMNRREAECVASILGAPSGEPEELAQGIYEKMGIFGTVVHHAREAACVIGGEKARMDVPYCEKPLLTVGAGDSFNGGFCHGLICGKSPEETLKTAVAVSGFYVRNGRGPNEAELDEFIRNTVK